MSFETEYFHERVLHEIELWPVDVLADYARIRFVRQVWPDCRCIPSVWAYGRKRT